MNNKIGTNFSLPNELVEISIKALHAGHKIKLCSLLPPIPTKEELAEEADLWEVAAEIET